MTREQGGGSFFQRLREWLAGLLAPGAASGSRRQARGSGVTPETVRPLARPTSLGPKATVVEAVAQGQKYFLKTWTDLPGPVWSALSPRQQAAIQDLSGPPPRRDRPGRPE
ncbi:MAG: hypothetical protein EBS42_11190 [Caulobacteraceae bacterium]|nr:hypothetical protein [Caulobacteraceae bacterium]